MKIRVPDGMLKAAEKYGEGNSSFGMVKIEGILEVALRWLDAELEQMRMTYRMQQSKRGYPLTGDPERLSGFEEALDRVCRMFLAEPEVPEEVKDLLMSEFEKKTFGDWNHRIIEAYVRGQRSK